MVFHSSCEEQAFNFLKLFKWILFRYKNAVTSITITITIFIVKQKSFGQIQSVRKFVRGDSPPRVLWLWRLSSKLFFIIYLVTLLDRAVIFCIWVTLDESNNRYQLLDSNLTQRFADRAYRIYLGHIFLVFDFINL